MAQAKQDLQAIINAAAEKEGLDPELLQKIGGAESSLKATAKNPKSTAKGLFQFVDKTWAEMGGKPGEQYNPQKNAELGARYVKRNMDMLTQTLGREPSYGEVYAAHFFGPTGAKALLTKADPNAPIEQSLAMFESPKRVAKVIRQNPNLKGKTTAQVLADLDAKMGSKKPVVTETPAVAPTVAAPTTPAKPKMGMFRRPVPRFIRSEAPNLGTGYNAALALMGMTDTDEDPLTKAQETVAQAEEDNSVADFGQAQKMLAQVQTPNAFANQPPRLMANGGEAKAEPQPEKGSAKAMLKEVARSTQYLPADIAGAPVDLINLGLQGVDALTGSKLAQKMPVGGAEWLIDKANKYGLMDKPTGSMTETLTRIGTGVLSPTAGPRAAVAAGKAIKGTAKAALEDLAMAGTGQGGSKFAQTLMEPGTAFATRPKGGAYLGAKSVDEPSLSGFDIKVKDFTANLDRNDPLQKEVFNFFDKKLRNYVTNQQGTVDDPIFKKLLEGKIENFTYATPEQFAAARAGDKTALKDVREAYDAAVPVSGYVGGKYGKTSRELYKLEQDMAAKIKEQSPDNYTTTMMAQARTMTPEQLEKYPSLYSPPGFKQFSQEAEASPLERMLNKTDLPPHLRRAIAEGEPVYAMSGPSNVLIDRATDMSQIRDYLLNRTPAEIKNMGVADVVEKSAEWHARLAAARRDPTNFSRKQLFDGTQDVMPLSNNTKIVDVQTKDALALEGNIMKHCVGGSNYCNGVARGDIKVYSLRDRNGIPQATIELRMGSDEKYNNVFQIKGVEDKPVAEEFLPQIDEFLTTYSDKLGDTPLIINESPRFLPETWRDR
jgi:hypothetical protein